jgi:hypothetical protein
MNRWEYSSIYVSSYNNSIEVLNGMGDLGWELTAIVSGWAFFKRPIEEKPAQQMMIEPAAKKAPAKKKAGRKPTAKKAAKK